MWVMVVDGVVIEHELWQVSVMPSIGTITMQEWRLKEWSSCRTDMASGEYVEHGPWQVSMMQSASLLKYMYVPVLKVLRIWMVWAEHSKISNIISYWSGCWEKLLTVQLSVNKSVIFFWKKVSDMFLNHYSIEINPFITSVLINICIYFWWLLVSYVTRMGQFFIWSFWRFCILTTNRVNV